MTWTLLHQRMAFMAEIIEAAEIDAEAALDRPDRASEVAEFFGNEEGLLLSLRQRWLTMLAARLDQAAYEGIPAEQARDELAAANPGLRALLDVAARRSLRIRSMSRGERRVVDMHAGWTGDRLTVA